MAILKSHKLKVIYFICSHFYYFSIAIYSVFYEVSLLLPFDGMKWKADRECINRPEDSQTINNFFNFIYQWIHIFGFQCLLNIARGVTFTFISCCTFFCSLWNTRELVEWMNRREMQFGTTLAKKFSPVPYMKNDSTRRTEQQKIFILFYFWLEINKIQGGKMQTGRREIKSLKLCSKVGSCPSRSSWRKTTRKINPLKLQFMSWFLYFASGCRHTFRQSHKEGRKNQTPKVCRDERTIKRSRFIDQMHSDWYFLWGEKGSWLVRWQKGSQTIAKNFWDNFCESACKNSRVI